MHAENALSYKREDLVRGAREGGGFQASIDVMNVGWCQCCVVGVLGGAGRHLSMNVSASSTISIPFLGGGC